MIDVGQWRARRWENRAAGRYYEAHLAQDLWGEWVMVRVWGGLGTPRGRITVQPLVERGSGDAVFAVIAQRRARRGYLQIV